MRVALINDGAYPFRQSVAGTWCHRLIRGLPEHTFHLVAVPDHEPRAAFYAPTRNTETFTSVAAIPQQSRRRLRRAATARWQVPATVRRAATHASVLLCRGMMADTPGGLAMFRAGLRHLATIGAADGDLLRGVPLAAVLLDAWRAAEGTEHGLAMAAGTPPLVRPAASAPTRDDAEQTAAVLRRTLRVLTARLPAVDLNHATDAGASAVLALAAKWRSGTPFVLTEHHTYLDATPPLDGSGTPAARAMAVRFHRALARLAYAESAGVVAPTERLLRWALDHGADPATVSLTGYGVDPHSCPPLRGEPAEPTVTFVGPESDAAAMLGAMPWIRMSRPETRLIVAGPVFTTDPLVLANVSFLGPVNHRRSAYATGRVLVISGRHPAAPYAIVEAMMCGRPVICLDDGEFGPMVGSSAITVPYGDPARLARACLGLLDSPDQRRDMSTAAARRARSLYALRTTTDAVRVAYERAAGDGAAGGAAARVHAEVSDGEPIEMMRVRRPRATLLAAVGHGTPGRHSVDRRTNSGRHGAAAGLRNGIAAGQFTAQFGDEVARPR